MWLCEERARNSYPVMSDTSTKTYTVTLFNGPPTCTCMAYAMGKNRAVSTKPGAKPGKAWCKHIDRMYGIICDWTSDQQDEYTAGPLPECPKCGNAAIWDGDLEPIEEVAKEEALASLAEMIAEVENR
jgi:hypothetical protein